MSVAIGGDPPVHNILLTDLDKKGFPTARHLVISLNQVNNPWHGNRVADHGRLGHAGLDRNGNKFALGNIRFEEIAVNRVGMVGLNPDNLRQAIDNAGVIKF